MRRQRCDDLCWGMEAELDRLVARVPVGLPHASRETGRRGASRRRKLMLVAAEVAGEDFRSHVAGGWEVPVLARLELARLVRDATAVERELLSDFAQDQDGARSAAFRKRLQRFRCRVKAA